MNEMSSHSSAHGALAGVQAAHEATRSTGHKKKALASKYDAYKVYDPTS